MTKPRKPNGLPDASFLQEASGSREDMSDRKVAFSGFNGPPSFKEEEKDVHDDQDLQHQYQQFQTGGGPDDSEEDDEDDLDDDEDLEDWEDEDDEYPTPPSLRQPDGAFMQDEPLFAGGPLVSEVNSWKKQFEIDGHSIHLSDDVGGQGFIWRTLARTEYREIMNLQNTDPLQREEIICEICVLFPYEYNFASMASQKAGVPAVLAEQILHESGFRRPTPPVRL